MKTFFTVLRLCCLWLISNCFALCGLGQNRIQTIEFADSLSLVGNYNLSLKYYQRALFFSDDSNRIYLINRIGEVHFAAKNYSEASVFFHEAMELTENEKLKNTLNLQIAICNIYQKNFEKALEQLLTVVSNEKNNAFYIGICYFGLNDFEKTFDFFLLSLDSTQVDFEHKKQKLSILLCDNKKLTRPKVKTARMLSMIVPGSGLAYCGDWQNGANSLILNSVLLYACVDIALKYHPIDAVVGVFPWFWRYYRSGIKNAAYCANRKQTEHKNEVLNEAIDVLNQ